MIGSSKNNRENYPTKCFWTPEKETPVKFNPRLSANRLSNNWAQGWYFCRNEETCLTGGIDRCIGRYLSQLSVSQHIGRYMGWVLVEYQSSLRQVVVVSQYGLSVNSWLLHCRQITRIFLGFAGNQALGFLGLWFLPPFDHPCHLKPGVPAWVIRYYVSK